jgi:hypothetical protein
LVQQDFEGQADSSFTPVLFKTTNSRHGSLEISGTVTAAGQPISFAQVQLSGRTLDTICIYEITRTDHDGHYKFEHLAEGFYNLRPVEPGLKFRPVLQSVQNEGLSVRAGDPIAESGNAGGEPSCFAPHLHFEIQRRTAVQVIDHTNTGRLNVRFIPVDPYGWHPSTAKNDPYFKIPGLENVGLQNETIWALTPDPN